MEHDFFFFLIAFEFLLKFKKIIECEILGALLV